MQRSRLKRLLQSGKVAVGTFIFLRDPAVVEIAGRAGMDFVVIDCEHSGKTVETVEDMVRAAETAGVAPVVRVASVDESNITRLLDAGVQGLMIPRISSAQMAARASSAIKYPPHGVRGVCRVSRSAKFGEFMTGMNQYMRRANAEIALIGTIEDKEGVESVSPIVEAGRFDACIVGRGDLSADLGVPGQMESTEVKRAVAKVERAVTRTNCALGLATYDLDEARRFIRKGYKCIIFSADVYSLGNSLMAPAAALHRHGAA